MSFTSFRPAAYVVHNPKGIEEANLPIIYGFNNGNFNGDSGDVYGVLLAQDGTFLGSHLSSSEMFLYGDLGTTEPRSARHEHFQKYYPDGYRMTFIPYANVETCAGLQDAIALNREQRDMSEASA